MRLRQLETFIAACELGSISRAAEKLYIAQPALGLQIRGLEDDLGVRLLERLPRGVEPTEAGKLVLEWARETVLSKRQLKERLALIGSGVSGRITFGLTPSVAAAFAVPILIAVQSELPDLHIQLAEDRGQVLRQWIESGQLDLALAFDMPQQPTDDACLLTERLHFVTAHEGAAASDAPITMAEVLDHPLVLPSSGDSLRQCVADAAQAMGLALRIMYEVQASAVVVSLVKNAFAATVLPISLAAEGVQSGELTTRPIVKPLLTRNLRWLKSGKATIQDGLLHDLQRVVQRTVQREIASGPLKHAYLSGRGAWG